MNSFIQDTGFPLTFQLCISRDFFSSFSGELQDVHLVRVSNRALHITDDPSF